MAQNIKNLPEIDGVQVGDFLLIEAPEGTRILKYENFRVTEDLTSFSDKLSSYAEGIATSLSRSATVTAAILGGNQDLLVRSLSGSAALSASGAIYIDAFKIDSSQIAGTLSFFGHTTATGVIYASAGNSNQWTSVYTSVTPESGKWVSGTLTLSGLSGRWESAYLTSTELTGRWESVYSTVTGNSATWAGGSTKWTEPGGSITHLTQTGNKVSIGQTSSEEKLSVAGNISASGNLFDLTGNSHEWRSTRSIVNANSASWDSAGDTSKGSSAHSTVNSNSAKWDSSYDTGNSLSSRWESVYTSTTDNSANWVSTYNQVQDSTTDLNVDSGTLFVDKSTNRVGIGATNPEHELSVRGSISATGDIYVSNSSLKFEDGTGFSSGDLSLLKTNSGRWESAYSNVTGSSAEWNSAYTTSTSNSGRWESNYSTSTSNSGRWESAYTTSTSNSGRWESTYETTTPLTGRWESVYSAVTANSSTWDSGGTIGARGSSAYSTLTANSASWVDGSGSALYLPKWSDVDTLGTSIVYDTGTKIGVGVTAPTESLTVSGGVSARGTIFDSNGNSVEWRGTRSVVEANSASWVTAANSDKANTLYATVNPLTGRWESVYSTVTSTSSDWESTHTAVYDNSASWSTNNAGRGNSAYSSLTGTSGDWESTHTIVNSTSGRWESVYTTVTDNSATWDGTSSGLELRGGSAYSTVTAGSAEWDSVYASMSPNSGDWESTHTIVYDNSASWGTTNAARGNSAYSTLTGNSATWSYVANNSASKERVDSLYTSIPPTSGDWESTHSTVFNTSATWGSTNAARGDSAYSTVTAGSAEWDSVYSSVTTTSGEWDNARSTTNANSSVWSSWIANGTNEIYTLSAVGIKISDPSHSLTVAGDVSAQSVVYAPDIKVLDDGSNPAVIIGDTEAANDYGSLKWDSITSTFRIGTQTDADNITIKTNSTIGIGVTTPNEKLTVAGNISAQNTIYDASGNSHEWRSSRATVEANSATWTAHSDTTRGNSAFSTLSTTSADWESTHTTVYDSSANWGVNPRGSSAYSTLTANSAIWTYVAENSALSSGWTTDNNNVYVTHSLSSVGIGTQTPQAKLEVETNDTENLNSVFIDQNDTGAYNALLIDSEASAPVINTTGGGILVTQDKTSQYGLRIVRDISEAGSSPLVTFIDDNTSNEQTTLRIQQDGTGDILNLVDGTTEVLTVLDGGNVGIGTTSPDVKLSVAGKLSADGDLVITNNALLSGDIVVGGSDIIIKGASPKIQSLETSPIYIATNANNRIYVDGDSTKIGIGTVNPSVELTVAGDISARGDIYTSNNSIKYASGQAWNSSDVTSVKNNSGSWDSVHTTSQSNSSKWSSVYDTISPLTAQWDSTYSSVTASSGSWNDVLQKDRWESTYTTLTSESGDWNSTHTVVYTNSATWESGGTSNARGLSVYSTVTANSAAWISAHTTLLPNSSRWESSYTTVAAGSATWDLATGNAKGHSAYSTLTGSSGAWDSAHTTTLSNSSKWESSYTSLTDVSGKWDGVYTTVNPASAKWHSVYSIVSANSGNWELGTGWVDSGTILYLTTSTDTVGIGTQTPNEKLTIVGNVCAQGVVYDTTSNSFNWGSTHTTVNANSGVWDTGYTSSQTNSTNISGLRATLNSNSGRWESTYETSSPLTGRWESVYSSVTGNSGTWNSTNAARGNSAYSTLTGNSATWSYVAVNSASADTLASIHASVSPTSGDWESTHTVVYDNSASWNAASTGWADDGTVVRLTTSTDKVGIGTTLPSETLTISGTVSALGGVSGTGDVNYLSGKLGIATNSPDAPIHVTGYTDVQVLVESQDQKALIGFTDSMTTGSVSSVSVGANRNDLVFLTQGNTNMALMSTGNLMLGNFPAEPQGQLHLYGSANSMIVCESTDPYALITFKDDANGSQYNETWAGAYRRDLVFGTQNSTRMVVTSAGIVGINTSDPTSSQGAYTNIKLHINGQALADAWPTTSDQRLKENITKIDSGLSKVMSLTGITFDWEDDYANDTARSPYRRQIGMIAQDVEQVIPELVSTWSLSGQEYLAVDYARMVAVLVEAVKELKQEIDVLKGDSDDD